MDRAMARPMPVGRRGELLLHQRSAAIVPHDLPIAHAVARADRLFGKMHCGRALWAVPCSHASAGDACFWREHEPHGPDGGRDWRGGCQCRPSGDCGRELGIGGNGGGGGSCSAWGGGAGGIAADVGCSVGDTDPPAACCALSGDANIPNASVAQARTTIRCMLILPQPAGADACGEPGTRIDTAQPAGQH